MHGGIINDTSMDMDVISMSSSKTAMMIGFLVIFLQASSARSKNELSGINVDVMGTVWYISMS